MFFVCDLLLVLASVGLVQLESANTVITESFDSFLEGTSSGIPW